jgi:hypothetical protein
LFQGSNETWIFFPRTSRTFSNAAIHGNLENMQWLFEKEYPWNYYTFRNATEHGNLENLQWLFENGCPLGTFDI